MILSNGQVDALVAQFRAMVKRRGDCHDSDFRIPPVEEAQYDYTHWSERDAIREPHSMMTEVRHRAAIEAYRTVALLNPAVSEVKTGDVVLRMLRYRTLRPLEPHIDIDLYTYNIASFDGAGRINPRCTLHYGSFAERLGLAKGKVHMFNPDGLKFSLVLFVVPHFSVQLPCSNTVGDILVKNCY